MIAIDKTRKPFKRGSKNRKSNGVKNYRLPFSGSFLQGSGGGDAGARIYKPAMAAAMKDRQLTRFVDPSSDIVFGK